VRATLRVFTKWGCNPSACQVQIPVVGDAHYVA